MTLQEILDEIAEKYPHELNNASVIRKLNQVQNELFRTTFRERATAIFTLTKGVFVYTLPIPRTNVESVLVQGRPYLHQSVAKHSNIPFYYFEGKTGLGIYPTPSENIVDGLTLFYFRYPTQLAEASLTAVPELDVDFHMLLVYGALVQICEVFNDVTMVNNYTSKYNGLIEEFQKALNKAPNDERIDDVMGGWWL
ncbi:phage adaptor protein [Paenibacillus sonchi]|uniref:phage adaptor protein n=1 Tax=Paenibacillus sonchi TaxID=373687 RepID=UPI001E28A90B|nr:hypothetical protein [Paenibacillus sonchi]MCE3202473.1 hypothetical protein [Paenibacillus sonchi]